MRRTAMRAALAALVGVCFVAACSTGGSEAGDRVLTTTTVPAARPELLCDLVGIPLEAMREDGTTFVDVVEDQTGEEADDAIGAMVALGLMARGSDAAGRFEPVLRYLAERAVAGEEGNGEPPPELTPGIRANARALDRELARQGCG